MVAEVLSAVAGFKLSGKFISQLLLKVKGSSGVADDLAVDALVAGKQRVHALNVDVLINVVLGDLGDVLQHLRIEVVFRVFFDFAYRVQTFLRLGVELGNFLAEGQRLELLVEDLHGLADLVVLLRERAVAGQDRVVDVLEQQYLLERVCMVLLKHVRERRLATGLRRAC